MALAYVVGGFVLGLLFAWAFVERRRPAEHGVRVVVEVEGAAVLDMSCRQLDAYLDRFDESPVTLWDGYEMNTGKPIVLSVRSE